MARSIVLWIAIFILTFLTLFIGGCAQQQGGNVSMTNQSITTGNATPGTVTDLTNAGSPYAAEYNGGTSQTRLESVPGFTPDLGLEMVAGNFTAPMMVADPGDGSGRLFVVEQTGLVKIVEPNGTVLDQPFMDLRDRLVTLNSRYDERGLLSIAFHPDYRNNGKVYAFYGAPLREGAPIGWSCTNHISEFIVSSESPDRVNMTSEKILMYIDKPYQNHNGGQLVFGPRDGYLYIPLGDGGGANDVGTGHTPGIGNGQDLTKIYGKILRIDVDNTSTGVFSAPPSNGQTWTFDRTLYGIPPDNPFAANKTPILSSYAYDTIPPEIFAYGLRNPAYITIDSAGANALFAADAGQLLFEEVDLVLSGGNYGWNIREGTHCFNPDSPGRPPAECSIAGHQGEPLIGPIAEGGHDLGNVVVGGALYRGSSLPSFQGRYLFGYWSGGSSQNGVLLVASPPAGWSERDLPNSSANLTPADNGMWAIQKVNVKNQPEEQVNGYLRAISEGSNREIYVLTNDAGGPDPSDHSGKVWRVVPP